MTHSHYIATLDGILLDLVAIMALAAILNVVAFMDLVAIMHRFKFG